MVLNSMNLCVWFCLPVCHVSSAWPSSCSQCARGHQHRRTKAGVPCLCCARCGLKFPVKLPSFDGQCELYQEKSWNERLVLGFLRKCVYTVGPCSERADKRGKTSCTLNQIADGTNLGRSVDLWRVGRLYRGIWAGWRDGLWPVG